MTRIARAAMYALQHQYGATMRSHFSLHVHPGARAWTPPKYLLTTIRARYTDPNWVVHLWPRSMAEEVHGRPSKPYSFRGFTRNGISHIFVDETETPESIAWMIVHELTHQMLKLSSNIKEQLATRRPTHLDPASDEFHRVDPEEMLCDRMATMTIDENYDRDWWRTRIRQLVPRS